MVGSLNGKVALITGASRGIGRAIAERFADEGAKLFLGCRRNGDSLKATADECRVRGVEVETFMGDIGCASICADMIDGAVARFCRLDILVNNAGVVHEGLLATVDDAELEEMLRTNVLGTVYLSRAALRPMMRQRGGSIINFSSASASRPNRGNSVYAGTKGFIESFSRGLAVEVGRKGIRVNVVAPGVIETEMTSAVRALAGEEISARIGLARFGRSGEVASAALFLASEESGYVNGAVLAVDGGYH
jgi:3-oxoacyl-[acyl-carrier protein] reductase